MSLFKRPFLVETPASENVCVSKWKSCGRAIGKGTLLLICAAATAVLFKLSYPKPAYSLLAWLALFPFTIGILRCEKITGAFWYAWLSGTAVYAGLYYWIFLTCWQGGGLSVGLSLAAWAGLSAVLALQFAFFGASCFYFRRLHSFFPLLAAMGWVALEWGHEMLATYVLGFPWFTLGYSQWNLPAIVQLASWTGTAGVSFVVAFAAISIGYGFATPSLRKGIFHLLTALCVFLAVYGYGTWYLNRPAERTLLSLRVALMQPNIDQYKKWTPQFEQEIQQTLQHMSQQISQEQVMLVIWPESVTPGPAQEEPYLSWIGQLAQVSQAWQLVGSNRAQGAKQYVSAFLFSPQGSVAGFYDKTHLVPFGEFIPFEKWLNEFFPHVQVLGELGGFSAGKWNQPLLAIDQISFGNSICYESVFPHLWREQTRGGARFLTNITNDAWFFDTDAPYQHMAVSVLRAVETRRPVLRAANTGISAIISPRGEFLAKADLNTRAVLVQDVALPLGLQESFYVRWGEWFAWLCAAFYMTMLISVMAFVYE